MSETEEPNEKKNFEEMSPLEIAQEAIAIARQEGWDDEKLAQVMALNMLQVRDVATKAEEDRCERLLATAKYQDIRALVERCRKKWTGLKPAETGKIITLPSIVRPGGHNA